MAVHRNDITVWVVGIDRSCQLVCCQTAFRVLNCVIHDDCSIPNLVKKRISVCKHLVTDCQVQLGCLAVKLQWFQMVFLLHGIVILLPCSFFIDAIDDDLSLIWGVDTTLNGKQDRLGHNIHVRTLNRIFQLGIRTLAGSDNRCSSETEAEFFHVFDMIGVIQFHFFVIICGYSRYISLKIIIVI